MSKKKEPDNEARRQFFSEKMAWLSRKCSDPSIQDGDYRILATLVIEYLSNDPADPWCGPSDAALGRSCGGKSVSTVGRSTKRLKADGHLNKRRRNGSSLYTFPGLTEDRSHVTEANETRSVIPDMKIGQSGHEDRSPGDRTEPSYRTFVFKPSCLASQLDNSGDTLEASEEAFSKEPISSDHPESNGERLERLNRLMESLGGGRRRAQN